MTVALTFVGLATGVIHPGMIQPEIEPIPAEGYGVMIPLPVAVALDHFAEWLTFTLPDGVETALADAAVEYGVDLDLLREIVRCESGGNPLALNRSSGASGLGQHLRSYYSARAEAVGYPDELIDPFRPRQNSRVTAWLLATQGTRPWNASKHCWN